MSVVPCFSRKDVELTVAAFIGVLKSAVTALFSATFEAPSTGSVRITSGALPVLKLQVVSFRI